MKKVLFCLMLLSSLTLSAQKPFERDSVIQVPGKTTTEIYNAVKTWFVENAKFDSRNIIQVDNPQDGILTGKGSIPIKFGGIGLGHCITGHLEFITDVRIKEGRFKVHMYQFMHYRENTQCDPSYNQGLIYTEIPAEKKGFWGKPYRKVHEAAIPLINKWCDNTFKTMKEKVDNGAKETENW